MSTIDFTDDSEIASQCLLRIITRSVMATMVVEVISESFLNTAKT
jgi:hypothetical protein